MYTRQPNMSLDNTLFSQLANHSLHSTCTMKEYFIYHQGQSVHLQNAMRHLCLSVHHHQLDPGPTCTNTGPNLDLHRPTLILYMYHLHRPNLDLNVPTQA